MGGEQDDWMWVCVGWSRGVLWLVRRECVVWFFFFVLSLWGVILLSGVWFVFARSLVVDWFCLSFFFNVTLFSFLMVCLVCEVCLFVWIWYLTTCSVLLSCTWFCVSIVSSSLF